MKPRSYWGSLLSVGVIVFPVSIVLWSLILSLGRDVTLGESFSGTGLWAGLIFGAVMTLVMSFVVRSRTITVPVLNKDAFVPEIAKTLAATGYHLESQAGNVLTFGPSARAGILAPKISVEIGDASATIVGPSAQLTKLRKRL